MMNIQLMRGQLVCTATELGKILNQDKQRVSYWLDRFVEEEMIIVEYIVKSNQSRKIKQRTKLITGRETEPRIARRTGYRIVPRTESPNYREIAGLLITICHYNKYQLDSGLREMTGEDYRRTGRRISKRTNRRTDERTAGETSDRTINNNEEKGREMEKNILPKGEIIALPGHSSNSTTNAPAKLTTERAFKIWEEEKGVLPELRVKELGKIQNLVEYLNAHNDGKDPGALWIEIIHRARQCHEDHRPFMSPYFFSKDLTHVDQVLNGLYDKSFSRGKYGPTKIERAGRGDAQDFGFKSGRRRRITTLGSSEVPEM
jgi:hypothetical protein